LGGKWRRFRNKDMTLEEFRAMSQEIEDFLALALEHADRIHGNLSEVMLAQDFQDLTGQIIRRVIALVQEVEERLVELVRLSGGVEPDSDSGRRGDASLARGQGPAVPGVSEAGGTVSGQDEVDDLLSSLGF
ncbi:MAG TPA: protein phosphatase CheZ, partial [Gammaproteobacteria bacterium]|nr:protein phosphatase CheZ [Gammaproteobacteria bacterium]